MCVDGLVVAGFRQAMIDGSGDAYDELVREAEADGRCFVRPGPYVVTAAEEGTFPPREGAAQWRRVTLTGRDGVHYYTMTRLSLARGR